jgi:hypothetical protein
LTPKEIVHKVLSEPPGVTVLKADLHIHSVYSKEGAGLPTVSEILDKAVASGIGLVSITDHNNIEGYTEASQYIADNGLKIGLIPGVEISTGFSDLHLLAYFPSEGSPEETANNVRDHLVQLGIESNVQKHTPCAATTCTNKKPSEAAAYLKEKADAIVVIAHAEKGFKVSGIEKEELFSSDAVLAYEIVGEIPEALKSGVSEKCIIRSSDAHKVSEIGSIFTFIRGEKPDFPTLYAAFTDPSYRVSLDTRVANFPHLTGIMIEPHPGAKREGKGGMLDGFVCRFNDGLNCLIGERGTFKSSLIQFIRTVFDYSATGGMTKLYLEDERKVNGKFLSEVLGKDTMIHVVICVGPDDYIVVNCNYDGRTLKVTVVDTVGISQNRNPLDICPISLYVHDGIKVRAEDETWLTCLIDQLTPDVEEHNRSEAELLNLLRENRAKIQGFQPVEERIQIYKKEIEGLQEAMRKLGVSSEVANIVDEKQRVANWLADMQQKIAHITKPLVQLPDKIDWIPPPKVADDLGDVQQELNLIANESVMVDGILNDVRILAGKLPGVTANIESKAKDINLFYDKHIQTKFSGVADGDLEESVKKYRAFGETILEKEKLISEDEAVLKDKNPAVSERSEILDRLDRVRAERSAKRERRSKELWSSGKISIGWSTNGNREEYFQFIRLKTIVKGIQDELHKLPIVNSMSPRELAKLIREKDMETINKVSGISLDIVQKMFEFGPGFADCDLELEEVPFNDRPEIWFDDRGTKKPLGSLSAGQRATVLLKLILAGGIGPLIIDQPEDDIDNKVIYDEIVRDVRVEKAKRQIIVSTHQANIPVIGDAEKIIVLCSDGTHGSLGQQGCIENRGVTKYVLDILEGGKDALKLRYRKYQDEDLLV